MASKQSKFEHFPFRKPQVEQIKSEAVSKAEHAALAEEAERAAEEERAEFAEQEALDSRSFEELVGPVEPPKGPVTAPPHHSALHGRSSRKVRQPKHSTKMILERGQGVVSGRRSDVPARLIDALAAGPVMPHRELDLHGMAAHAARQTLTNFVAQAQADGIRSLLVICGQGVHSGPSGPVLPAVVIEELSERLRPKVLGFRSAPQRWGGAGAILVRLTR